MLYTIHTIEIIYQLFDKNWKLQLIAVQSGNYTNLVILMSACIDSGDTAWMLLSTMFVFLQIPATGILQAGMIRKKNSLSILMQVMSGLSIWKMCTCCRNA